MSNPKRIDVESAHDLLESGDVRLICAYEDEEKCNKLKLPWAIPFSEFQLMAPTLPAEQNLVFY